MQSDLINSMHTSKNICCLATYVCNFWNQTLATPRCKPPAEDIIYVKYVSQFERMGFTTVVALGLLHGKCPDVTFTISDKLKIPSVVFRWSYQKSNVQHIWIWPLDRWDLHRWQHCTYHLVIHLVKEEGYTRIHYTARVERCQQIDTHIRCN